MKYDKLMYSQVLVADKCLIILDQYWNYGQLSIPAVALQTLALQSSLSTTTPTVVYGLHNADDQ